MTLIAETYLLETIKSFRGLKSNAEKAFAQIQDADFHFQPDQESKSDLFDNFLCKAVVGIYSSDGPSGRVKHAIHRVHRRPVQTVQPKHGR